jgi:hypothetical protein
MAITTNISATYRGPGRVMRRLLEMGQREDRALAYLMAACGLMFLGQLPSLARQAHIAGEDLDMMMGGALMAWIVFAPLGLYFVAFLTHLFARFVFRGKGSFYGARLALFWALLAAAPLFLLVGLVAGFLGQGLEWRIVGAIWLLCFLWFWIRGLMIAEQGVK